jgi:hypothetical protein
VKYSEKLRDPRWQRRRLEVMQRDDFRCKCCGDALSTLNVHHLMYVKEPWDCPLEKLETLCERCHEWRSAIGKRISNMPTALISELWSDLVYTRAENAFSNAVLDGCGFAEMRDGQVFVKTKNKDAIRLIESDVAAMGDDYRDAFREIAMNHIAKRAKK